MGGPKSGVFFPRSPVLPELSMEVAGYSNVKGGLRPLETSSQRATLRPRLLDALCQFLGAAAEQRATTMPKPRPFRTYRERKQILF